MTPGRLCHNCCIPYFTFHMLSLLANLASFISLICKYFWRPHSILVAIGKKILSQYLSTTFSTTIITQGWELLLCTAGKWRGHWTLSVLGYGETCIWRWDISLVSPPPPSSGNNSNRCLKESMRCGLGLMLTGRHMGALPAWSYQCAWAEGNLLCCEVVGDIALRISQSSVFQQPLCGVPYPQRGKHKVMQAVVGGWQALSPMQQMGKHTLPSQLTRSGQLEGGCSLKRQTGGGVVSPTRICGRDLPQVGKNSSWLIHRWDQSCPFPLLLGPEVWSLTPWQGCVSPHMALLSGLYVPSPSRSPSWLTWRDQWS